jgi:DNA polymerase-3 subunit delta'
VENWGIVGHEWAVRLLQRALEQDELSHAYLFTGPPGVGKATLARVLGSAVLCLGEARRPCGECRACRLFTSGTHPDFHWVDPETSAGHLSIDQVRDLGRQLALTPSLGRHRIAVLSEFNRATLAAANALLKTLEEPPEHVILVLLAPDTDSLLPTIVSRCQVVPFRSLSPARVRQALIAQWGVEPEQAELLAHLSGGRMGWAAMAATDPAVLQVRERRLEELGGLLRASLVDRFRYAAELTSNPEAALETLELWTSWWRDVLLVAAGAEGFLTNPDRTDRLRRQARTVGLERAAALVRATRQATDLILRNANLRLTLEVLIAFDLPRL